MTHPAALATALHAADNENLGIFGHDPWWLILFKAVIAFAIFVVFTLFNIYFERKVVAWMQMRIGPNRVGPKGILQSLADGVKLPLKEDIVPTGADKVVFFLAPLLSAIPAFMAVAVIPFGPVVSIFHHKTALQLTDLPVGILYVLAVASIGIYGIVLAGWSSGSTYPLLGGLRSSAQMISYEIAMGLCFAAVFLQAGTMSTSGIVTGQQKIWYGVMLAPSFVVYVISMVGETNRAPFDLPEAEGELVGGFHTEYSSMKFAMFFLAEYVNMVTVSALAVTMFLGGWRAPWPITAFWAGANHGWFPMIWFIGKLLGFIFFFVWLRGTLPRLRYDQFMKIGWKVLIPFSILWLLAVATIKLLRDRGDLTWNHAAPIGIVVAVILIVLLGIAEVTERRQNRAAEEAAAAAGPAEFDPMAGGFPVPPMPGQVLPAYVPRGRRPALVGAVEPDETPDETSRTEEGSDV